VEESELLVKYIFTSHVCVLLNIITDTVHRVAKYVKQ